MNPADALTPASLPVLAPEVRFRIDPISGEPMLLFPEGLLLLSGTAAEIVSRCDGETSVSQLVAHMLDEYETDESTMRQDVLDCLAELYRRTLILLRP